MEENVNKNLVIKNNMWFRNTSISHAILLMCAFHYLISCYCAIKTKAYYVSKCTRSLLNQCTEENYFCMRIK